MSLPTPPSGILDKDRPWWRGKVSDAQWDRLKAKLTGGTDAGGTSYSKFIDCSAAEADKIISNLKKDPRGYPQMYMPGGGEAYQIMIDYFQWLKDSYLTEEPKEEDIPVEVEVVEVEQKQPDEPIVVKIEAPFEPTPTQPLSAPKTLRLPRRSGVIRPSKAKKKSAAERMAEAFDERLDDVLDSIKNPPEAPEPKQRKQKEKLVKIKRAVKPKSYFKEQQGPKPLENLSAFLGGKVKSAFGRAADARRMANEAGMPKQKKGFYVTRALGLEFGGDKIARTRGTFSRSPDATLDPSLTKQQRYMEGMFGSRTIRPGKTVDNNVEKLEDALSKLENTLRETVKTKENTPESEVSSLEKTVNELRDALIKNNKAQKDIVRVKTEQLELDYEVANHKEMAAKESEMEKGEDLSDFVDGVPEKKEEKEEEGGGGLDIGDMFDKFRKSKWLKRLKNPKRLARTLFRYGRRFIFKPLKAAATKVAGVVSGAAATTAAIVGGVGLAASGLGEGFFQLTKKGGAGEKTRDALKKKGEEIGGPLGSLIGGVGNLAGFSTEATKVTGNALDAIGAPFRYAIEGIRYPFLNEEDREKQADNLAKFDARIREYSRGWMNRIDFMNVVPDEKGGFGNIYGNDDAQKEMMEKMSEGGTIPEPKFQGISGARLTGDLGQGVKAMVGEAGPEMVMRAGMNPLQSLAPMISAVREITKRVGPWGDPIETYVQQVTGPLAKQLKLPVIPTNVDIGEGDITPKDTGDRKILGKKQNIFQKMLGSLFGGAAQAKGMGLGMNITPNMGGGDGKTTAGAVYDYLLSKGMSENHAKGITANISRESGFKLGAHNPNDPGAGSFGLFQWNGGRAQNMMAAVPDWQTNWKGQIDYALGEDHGPRYLSSTFPTAGAAAYDWMKYWERPAEYVQAKYTPAAYEGMIQKMNLTRGMSQQQTPDAPVVEAPETTLPTPQHQGPVIPAPQRPEAPATPAPAPPPPMAPASSPILTLPITPPPVPQQQQEQSLFMPQSKTEDPFERWRKLRLATN